MQIPLDADIAALGGLLRRDWGKSHGVGLNDALMAATAFSSNRVLLSLNAQHHPMRDKGRLVVPYKNRSALPPTPPGPTTGIGTPRSVVLK